MSDQHEHFEYDTCSCGRRKRRSNPVCSGCNRFSNARFRDGQGRKVQDRYYEVLWCPRNEFHHGARFLISEFKDGLKMGIWPLGMIIKHSVSGTIRVVCGDGKVYREPLPMVFPKQRLETTNGRTRRVIERKQIMEAK